MSKGNGSRKPPPVAGAFDLDQLRRSPVDEGKVREAVARLMLEGGLICPCGERVRDEGLGVSVFHSATCPAFLQQLAAERPAEAPQPIAVRRAAQIDWLVDQTDTAT